jgi:hypothetical protein
MPVPELDPRGVTPELEIRLKFYCSWTWCFFFFFLFFFNFLLFIFFVYFIIVSFSFLFFFLFTFFLSVLSMLPSPLSHSYSHPLHSPSLFCVQIHCSPSQLLFLPLPIHHFSLPSPSPPILPQPVTRPPLSPTHSPPADQPIIPTLHNPKPL